MKTKNGQRVTALGMAYAVVMEELKYTHKRLKEENWQVNYPTLRRIREGQEVKRATKRFFYALFVRLIDREYWRRMAGGGDGAVELLRLLHDIHMAYVDEELVKR